MQKEDKEQKDVQVYGIINKYCRGDYMDFGKLAIYNFLLLFVFEGLWAGVNILFVLIDFILNPAIAMGGFLTIEFLILKILKKDLTDKKYKGQMGYEIFKVMYYGGMLGIPIFFIGIIIQIVDLFK